jgi:RNA polymerase sigma factor (sigma-70 family)
VRAADAAIESLLEELRSEDARLAWRTFLTSYSDLIYGVIRTLARNADHAGDCFLFVCEKLADKKYRRLRRFSPDGRARFSTWLRVVVRNLCLDWHRARFGRRQVFRSVASLSATEQEIFGLLFLRRLSTQDAWSEFAQSCRGVSYTEFEITAEKLRRQLTSRQLWLLSTASTTLESLDGDPELSLAYQLVDPTPDPEAQAVLRQTHTSVDRVLEALHPSDRLLLRLRFSEGLGLQEVAKLVGLKDAQTAHRRIRNALDLVRRKLGDPKTLVGKPRSASV